MPYLEDGETWDTDYKQHMDGMAENQPGHKRFDEYALPKWARHPMSHPFSGVYVEVKDYAYASLSGAMDGLGNFHGWGPAHIACMFGDMEMLESCSDAEISARNNNEETPAYVSVRYGYPWCLQWLVEHGADVTTPAINGYTPEQLIWINNRNDNVEMESLESAFKGDFTNDKKVSAALDFKLKKWRAEGMDAPAEEHLDKNKLKQRWHMYKMGDYKMPYDLPSVEECRAKMDIPRSTIPRPPAKSKPALPAALLFPGQGSQIVGMCTKALQLPAVQSMFEKAEKILGWNVKDLCLNGPKEKLSETRYCQPVMFIAGMAGLQVMRESAKREVVERPQAVAGLSLGEYTAICAAGVLDFEQCLRLVKLRADAMQDATEKVSQCMCSVAGLHRDQLDKLCAEARAADTIPNPVCQIANVLFPAGFTCAGTTTTITILCARAKAAGALQAKPIETGGAFHSPLMIPASDRLNAALDEILPKMKPPRCCIYFNLTGKKVPQGTPPSQFIDLMKKQLTNEVLWEKTVQQMVMDQVKDFYEIGPNKQIKSMIKRIDQDAFKRTENIEP